MIFALHPGLSWRFVCWLVLAVLPFLLITIKPVSADTRTYGLVVVGLGGNNDYREMFEEAASATINAVNPPALEGSENTETEHAGLQLLLEHEASRETILEQLAAQIELANQQPQDSRFMVMLFGHGNYDGENYRFNTKGADITAAEIHEALKPLEAGNQFLLFATSASGAVLDIFADLTGESADEPADLATDLATNSTEDRQDNNREVAAARQQRIVVTATKSGAEANAVQFPRYWSEVLASQLADTDHNELLTVREAYDAVAEGVARHYDNRQLLATEHSRALSGNGDFMVLARLGSLRGQENNIEVNRLLQQRQQLEVEFNQVRATRDAKIESDYLDELEQVLLQIARLQLRIDQATGWQPDGGIPALADDNPNGENSE